MYACCVNPAFSNCYNDKINIKYEFDILNL